MPQIRQSVSFRKWLVRLEDRTAQARDILRARQMIEQLDSRQ